MPVSLRTKLMQGFRMIDSTRKQASMASQYIAQTPENIAATNNLEAMERQMWNMVPTTGVMQITYDAKTGARKSLFMNQRFATIFGFHR
jgi:hypothetical protein